MAVSQYQVTMFNSAQEQILHNVKIHSPSIIQIIYGEKRLFLSDGQIKSVFNSKLLLCKSSTSLSFTNIPHSRRFTSRVFSFNCLCSDEMIKLSQVRGASITDNLINLDKALQDTLNALASFNRNSLSEETQAFWLMGFYQQLAEKGVLHLLFPNTNVALKQQISCYLADAPNYEHSLEKTADNFCMSRSTLIRKLKQEGAKFKDILIEVRLNYALILIQNGCYNITILTQQCGYQSKTKFSQRFKEKFGLTLSSYIKSLK